MTVKAVWHIVKECCQKHRSGEVGAARTATDLCSALPRIRRRVGADPISSGTFGGNDRTLPWLQAADRSAVNDRIGMSRIPELRRKCWKVS